MALKRSGQGICRAEMPRNHCSDAALMRLWNDTSNSLSAAQQRVPTNLRYIKMLRLWFGYAWQEAATEIRLARHFNSRQDTPHDHIRIQALNLGFGLENDAMPVDRTHQELHIIGTNILSPLHCGIGFASQ